MNEFLNSGIIEDEIMNRSWSLNDVLEMDNTVDEIVQGLITDMDIETKYHIVKDVEWGGENDISVKQIISMALREELKTMVSFVVNRYLKDAKVSFNDNNNTDKLDKKKDGKSEVVVENKVEQPVVIPSQDEKIMTLKERIKQDTKEMSSLDKKRAGLI